jgi:hypothetical protein
MWVAATLEQLDGELGTPEHYRQRRASDPTSSIVRAHVGLYEAVRSHLADQKFIERK